jgi:hypothetical protein
MRVRENMLGVGAYPEVSLRAAREHAEDARRQLGAGAYPAAARRIEAHGKAGGNVVPIRRHGSVHDRMTGFVRPLRGRRHSAPS